ncbi:ACP S-malonyltransferase [Gordonia jinhuaensis]|uniref:[acyl-carrier-protein] S-malonyltransferase n=1 Tax=Gordonia jinhuaensis TaxID=1517702 RepID=A0A916WTP3_9ACTN|nr:ACP S-malonyltransferase [Gordonia jinhuaensis]GGB33397.1 putative malonyl CoA-acyl carrier protein transacylase [Gordonia jinhuaensis]
MAITLNEELERSKFESPVAPGAIFLCPGQGAQYRGLLDPWLTTARANEMCDRWSRAIGLDLRAVSRDRAALEDTAIVQPLITAASLLAFEALSHEVWFDRSRSAVLGHSVGELAASAIAGFYSFDTAMSIARSRGLRMAECCSAQATGMLALMPSRKNPASSEEIVRIAAASPDVEIANINGAGQVVVAGSSEGIESFELSLGRNVRAVHLDVAGAFHSQYMEPARVAFARDLEIIKFGDNLPSRPTFYSNFDGAVVHRGADLKNRLCNQIVSPVRWDKCMESADSTSRSLHVIELAPGTSYGKLWARHHGPESRQVFSLDGDFNRLTRR